MFCFLQSQLLKQGVAHLKAAPIAPDIATCATSETPHCHGKTGNKDILCCFSTVALEQASENLTNHSLAMMSHSTRISNLHVRIIKWSHSRSVARAPCAPAGWHCCLTSSNLHLSLQHTARWTKSELHKSNQCTRRPSRPTWRHPYWRAWCITAHCGKKQTFISS